ncbi:MAG: mucoidy inhibitor MuiA family protein [Planctomycetota bacterium]
MIPISAALALVAVVQDPVAVPSRIEEVTVYPGTAAVRRVATLPSGAGAFVLEGLPRALDAGALRVRAEGAEIVGVELRERVLASAPGERVSELTGRLAALRRELRRVDDEDEINERVRAHLERLIAPKPIADSGGVERAPLSAWEERFNYLATRLAAVQNRTRELERARRDLQRDVDALGLELGAIEEGGGVPVFDLHLDAFGAEGPAAVEVDYLVPQAGWSPVYDLRAARDLTAVELSYRARVWQRSGEDWNDVELLLSTAQPQRGAQGPEPRATWVGLNDPRAIAGADGFYDDGIDADALRGEMEFRNKAVLGRAFTTVESEGLSVRFRLPQRETVESRPQPASVLVGRASLAITPEHYCVPALDPTVWLRAKAKNTSDYALLPGRASVFFGADFLGHADLPAVQVGEELTLPLGQDPGLTVERIQIEGKNEEPGVFGSRRAERGTWRIHLKNRGALSRRANGAVDVVVHESLPRATDDRIEVELERVRPELAGGARWKELRKERGVLTWVARVPKGGGTTIELTTTIEYPEDVVLRRR